jgi:hypothetical protein
MDKKRDKKRDINELFKNYSINNFYLFKKNGILFSNNIFYYDHSIFLLLNNFIRFCTISFYNILIGKTENDIVNNLLILKYSQKNIQYCNFKGLIYIFKKKNIDIFINYLYIKYYLLKKYNNLLKKNNILIQLFYIKKMLYTSKISNNKIFIELFYTIYIYLIKKEIKKKYNKTFNDFPNYNKLYIFLKKHGYVNKYYSNMIPIIKKRYKTFFNIKINSKFEKFKNKIIKKIKDLSNIDLYELIDNNINDTFNKVYIKNKFNKMIKIYNI